MKIAVNSRIYAFTKTGIQRYIEHIYKEVAKLHPETELVFFQTTREKTLGRTLVIPAFLGVIGITLFDLFLVIFFIRKERPDVYHGPAHVLPLIKIPGVKYALTIHDCAPFTVPSSYSFLYRFYFKTTLRLSVRNADVIFAVSENTKNDVVRLFGVSPSKIFVTYCGFDSLLQKEVEASFTRNKQFLLAAVTHPKRKNIVGTLKAFSLFVKSNPKHADVEFVCVGSIQEHDRQKLVQLSRELGIESSCHFLGFVDDSELACLYAQTIALVYPSFYEGFGMPPVEAYFLGALPLVSDVSSLPEIVPIPELRFDPYSETSIADHMSFVFSLSKEQRSEYSVLLKKHAEKFNWEYAARVFWQGIQ